MWTMISPSIPDSIPMSSLHLRPRATRRPAPNAKISSTLMASSAGRRIKASTFDLKGRPKSATRAKRHNVLADRLTRAMRADGDGAALLIPLALKPPVRGELMAYLARFVTTSDDLFGDSPRAVVK